MIEGLRTRLGLVRTEAQGTTEAEDIIARLTPYTVGGSPMIARLRRLAVDLAARGIPGDFVECGVCNGGSAGAIASALADERRHVWLYDSFAGMPPTDEVDGAYAATLVGTYVGSVVRVQEALTVAGVPEEQVTIHEGLFEDTFRQELPAEVAFLHIDADWYASVKLALETFYDRVSPGGLVVLDDFGHWEGCREAFYDFACERDLKPLLERLGHTQAFWVKGRAHNRDVTLPWGEVTSDGS